MTHTITTTVDGKEYTVIISETSLKEVVEEMKGSDIKHIHTYISAEVKSN